MRERPILFSAPMVRAVLSGVKTQTRRVITPQPSLTESRIAPGCQIMRWRDKVDTPLNIAAECLARFCPYGAPGDMLWVRETWARTATGPIYRADSEDAVWRAEAGRWRPSIHMPRVYSRITLEITGIRVERVRDISEADAQAEGVSLTYWAAWSGHITAPNGQPAMVQYITDPHNPGEPPAGMRGAELQRWTEPPMHCLGFAALWDSINGKRGHGWDANPWVWVIEFRRIPC